MKYYWNKFKDLMPDMTVIEYMIILAILGILLSIVMDFRKQSYIDKNCAITNKSKIVSTIQYIDGRAYPMTNTQYLYRCKDGKNIWR